MSSPAPLSSSLGERSPAWGTGFDWKALALGLYLVGVLLLLAKVLFERAIVRRLRRDAIVIDDADWVAFAQSLATELGVRRRVALLRSRTRTMPMTWGVRRPCILLPVDARRWSAERRRAVLLHELAHVARHDCLTQTIAAVACALYWPHPGAWWAASRLRVERELACDDRALAHGIGGRQYALQLLEIARSLRAPRAVATAAVTMASQSHLERRLLAAIDDSRARATPGRRACAVAAMLALALLLPLAAMRAAAEEPAGRLAQRPVTRAADVQLPPMVSVAARVATPIASNAPVATVAPVAPVVAPTADTAVTVAPPAAPVATQQGDWHMRMANAGEAPAGVATVHVMFLTNGINTFTVPLARLDGLGPAHFVAGDTSAHFVLRRDAGTLTFDGRFGAGKGRGRFAFVPAPAYGDSLVRRGMARPTAAEQWTIAQHGVELALLDTLGAYGYATPTTAQLARVAVTSVDVDYVRDMAAVGYRLGRVEALVRLTNHSIDASSIRALEGMGYRGLAPDVLVRLRTQGLDVARIRQLNADAGRTLDVDELFAARRRSVAPSRPPAATPVSLGDRTTPLEGRWVVHATRGSSADFELFWSDDTNWRQRIPAAALREVGVASTDGTRALRIEQDAGRFELEGRYADGRGAGTFRFVPDRDFVATLRSLGVTGLDAMSDHQLKNLAWGGMSEADVREFVALGYAPLALRDLIDMAIFQVDPAFVRRARAAGVPADAPIAKLIDLRRQTGSGERVRP